MCRCLGGCSHAMSNNEERAWEEWEERVAHRLTVIRNACNAVEYTVRLTRNVSNDITDAVARMEDATEALFRIRHGPERED